MGRAGWIVVAACLATGLSVPAGPDPATAAAPACLRAASSATASMSPARARSAVRCLVAVHRGRVGRRALHPVRQLRRAAELHARDMVTHDVFSHTGSDGRSAFDRVRAAGYAPHGWAMRTGEVLVWRSGPDVRIADLVDALMASPHHHALLLSARFRHLGVGLVSGTPQAGVREGATLVVVLGARRRPPSA